MGHSGWQVSQTCGSVPGMLRDGGEGYEVRRCDWLYQKASGCVSADNRFFSSLSGLAQIEKEMIFNQIVDEIQIL